MKLLRTEAWRVVVEISRAEFDTLYRAALTLDSSFHMLRANPYDLTGDLAGHCGDLLEDILQDASEILAEARHAS